MRNVYFDPFGSYTQGYDSGAQRQLGVEQDVRQARNQDYDFYNLAPLRKQLLQNETSVNSALVPFNIQYGIANADRASLGNASTRLGIGQEYGAATGDYGPTMQALQKATGFSFYPELDDKGVLTGHYISEDRNGNRTRIDAEQMRQYHNFAREIQRQQMVNMAAMYGMRFGTDPQLRAQTALGVAGIRAGAQVGAAQVRAGGANKPGSNYIGNIPMPSTGANGEPNYYSPPPQRQAPQQQAPQQQGGYNPYMMPYNPYIAPQPGMYGSNY